MSRKIVRLRESGAFEQGDGTYSGLAHLDKRAMLVYTGKFESMDGEVEIKDDDIDKLAANHNSTLAKLSRFAAGEVHPRHNPPVQLDHSTSARDTVGRLRGNIEVGEYEKDGQKLKALFGTPRILGKENVEKVEDGRWVHLSGGFDLENHTLSELTITPFPAAADASMLSRVDGKQDKVTKLSTEEPMGYKETKEKAEMYAKCKKHLMDSKKMSEEDADKHLESAKDEDLKKMSAEQDEHEAKMAAEKADTEKKEKDAKDAELKRLAALGTTKTNFIKLSKGLKENSGKVQLAAKKANITVRLARLQADTKLTPAERKGIDIEKLAASSPEVIEATLSSYDKREPVIDVGVRGSTKAATPSQIYNRMSKINPEIEELRTRLAMPSKRGDALKRLSELGLSEHDLEKSPSVHADTTQETVGPDHERLAQESYDHMKKLMGEGKEEEAKAHFKKHFRHMSEEGNAGSVHEVVGPDSMKHMSALADDVKKLHTDFDELVKLAAPVLGVTAEELA